MIDALPVPVLYGLEDAQLNFEALENAGLLTAPENLSGLPDIVAARLNLGIDGGTVVGVVAAGGSVTVAHGLGRTPVSVNITTFDNSVTPPNVGWAAQTLTTSHFTAFNPSASAAAGFTWTAIG